MNKLYDMSLSKAGALGYSLRKARVHIGLSEQYLQHMETPDDEVAMAGQDSAPQDDAALDGNESADKKTRGGKIEKRTKEDMFAYVISSMIKVVM
jgi:hypothetical protein